VQRAATARAKRTWIFVDMGRSVIEPRARVTPPRLARTEMRTAILGAGFPWDAQIEKQIEKKTTYRKTN
jgi:hypothetical protein